MEHNPESSTDTPQDPRLLRASPRHKIFQRTEARLGSESMRVYLLDLSATGALIQPATPLTVGIEIELDYAGAARRARVMNSDGARCGVHFLVPLTETEVAMVVAGQAGPA